MADSNSTPIVPTLLTSSPRSLPLSLLLWRQAVGGIVSRVPRTLLLVSAALWLMGSAALAAEPRFQSQFMNGTRLAGSDLHDWHAPQANPRLDGKPLFQAGDLVRWVQNEQASPAEWPQRFVEFYGGDRLPGVVSGAATGQEQPYRQTLPHLLVIPDVSLDWPDAVRPQGIPVLTRWLRRVVWERRADTRYRPSTLFYRDGRQIAYRAVRWSDDTVRLLLDQGTRDVPFDEIAELHLPNQDPWDVYFEQLAVLSPLCNSLLMRIETTHGLCVTSSQERFQARTHGGDKPDHWIHLVQPAWSTHPLWVRNSSVRVRRYFQPHEVPLTAIEPRRALQRAALAGGWAAQIDRNVHGGPLRCQEQSFGWGLGVHATSELEYPLHPAVRTFRTQLGLDQVAGRGGCVKAAVYFGPASGTPIFQSPVIIGSQGLLDTGALAVPTGASGNGLLTLVADSAHVGRPAGADPFEIRDTFDWLQPLLELDPVLLQAEVQQRQSRFVAPWQGWTVLEGTGFKVLNTLDVIDTQRPYYRAEIVPQPALVGLSRRLSVSPSHQFLLVSVSRREKEVQPSRVQVRIDQRAVAEFDVPVRTTSAEPDPLLIPVQSVRGRSPLVELFQLGEGAESRVEWHGIGLVDSDPTLLQVFEDEAGFLKALTEGRAVARVDSSDKYTGETSLKITPGLRGVARLPNLDAAVLGYPRLGEYRFLRFAWKKEGGERLELHLAHQGAWGADDTREVRESHRYRAGKSRDAATTAKQLDGRAPEKWELQTCDLFSDFGELRLTGLQFACPDGSSAGFDHIYLARKVQDFERVSKSNPAAPPDPLAAATPEVRATVERAEIDPLRFHEVLGVVAPAFTTAASQDGVWLFKEYRGRTQVVRTHPAGKDTPCVLRGVVSIPKAGQTQLLLTVSHEPQRDWRLIVKAGGELLHDSLVAESTAAEGWREVVVDLSKFAGQTIAVELHNASNNWDREQAYWERIEVQTK